jgi:Uma2 family endonuclease
LLVPHLSQNISILKKKTQRIVMSQTAIEDIRWTTSDLELLPQNEWIRREIIDGELFVTRAPDWKHQRTCGKIFRQLDVWSESTGLGQSSVAPGIIFTEADNVIPDVVWASHERLVTLLDEAGHLTGAPELVVEVLSPGNENQRRDKEAKLKLYSARGVQEYWIANWQSQTLEIYRRDNAQLHLIATLIKDDLLSSPLLPDFSCPVSQFFL